MRFLVVYLGIWLGAFAWAQVQPDVVIISIDALRRDRLSCEGYPRNTSPHIDAFMAQGLRFANARTIEPLTAPALASMLTSLHPHRHGATRNGVRVYPGMPSVPQTLAAQGYQTAAFVSNWTLKNRLCGLGEYFEDYHTVITKKRWFGLVKGEAHAEDVTQEAEAWLSANARFAPFFLWVHYIEPHAPYVWQDGFAQQLGYDGVRNPDRHQRYDSEVAYVDREVGRMLEIARSHSDNLLIIFTADHGESLGEHHYWGHGRNLHEPSLIVPLGFVWDGVIAPGVVEQPATILDIAPTILGLLRLPRSESFQGRDWSAVLFGTKDKFPPQTTFLQAHKGAVQSRHASQRKRRKGLLEVGVIQGNLKQIYRIKGEQLEMFDLDEDARETAARFPDTVPAVLSQWLDEVTRGLAKEGDRPLPATLEEEDVEALEGLGYIK